MSRTILVKPVITEKAEELSEGLSKYTFVVDKKANKVQIKKAIEEMYNVDVESVNTMIMPAKLMSRNTRSGVVKGRKPAYKKAIVTLAAGEEIDFFGDI